MTTGTDKPAICVPKPRVLVLQVHAENAGTQEISRLIDAGLSARGYDVHELYFFVRSTSLFRSAPNVVICAPRPPRGIVDRVRIAWRAIAEVRRLRPDVILCLQWDGNLFGAFLARLAGRSSAIANQFTAPLMHPAWARGLDGILGALGLYSRIVVNTGDVERRFASHSRFYRKRLTRIDHGFADKTSKLSKSAARAAFGLPQDVVLLGSVGRLVPQKHFDAAVRLLAHDSGWNLALCGQGVDADRLRALAKYLDADERLHLPGEIHPDKVGDFLAALDVFVFPAISESFGLAVAEAAQAGVPVVANDLEVLREVLAVDGEACALFVDADDTAAFAEAVARLLHDETLREHLTKSGRRLGTRYSLEHMYDGYDRMIKAVLGSA